MAGLSTIAAVKQTCMGTTGQSALNRGNGQQMQASEILGPIANGGDGAGTTMMIITGGEARFIAMGGMDINFPITLTIGPLIHLLFLTIPIRHIPTMGSGIAGAGLLMNLPSTAIQAIIAVHTRVCP